MYKRQLGQVPELGQSIELPGFESDIGLEPVANGTGNIWDSFLTTVSKTVDVGGTLYSKFVAPDIQKAQLDLARTNAETAASQARAIELAAKTGAAARAGTATTAPVPGVSTGFKIGGTALVLGAVGLGLFFFMGRKKRR